jgi:hypothetical protein
VSSNYQLICVSHDPAIVFGPEYGSRGQWSDPVPALAAEAERNDTAHAGCDLLVGRFSYPLIEVCCPRTRPRTRQSTGLHGPIYHPNTDEWIDADWLRLLAVSTPEQRATVSRTECWTWEVAWRLRHELGLTLEST